MEALPDKVTVVVRARPPAAEGARTCVRGDEGGRDVLTSDGGGERAGKALRFTYSRAFFWDAPGASTTRDVYEGVGRHVLEQALAGFHTSLLAYGQTGACAPSNARRRTHAPPQRGRYSPPARRGAGRGASRGAPARNAVRSPGASLTHTSLQFCARARACTHACRPLRAGSGKTHTLFGNAAEAGLVPMLAEELFGRLEALPASTSWRVECSVVEIYNERVRALRWRVCLRLRARTPCITTPGAARRGRRGTCGATPAARARARMRTRALVP
jgi:hypothetical protein